jgi:hypothetical protein
MSDTTVEVPLLGDFESWSKAEMLKHLHTHHSHYVSSKTPKKDIVIVHASLHACTTEEGYRQWSIERWGTAASEGEIRRGVRPLHVDHTHSAVGTSPTQQEMAEIIRQNEEFVPLEHPLNVSERKNLSTLVDNDFATARMQVARMTDELRAQRQAEIVERFSERRESAEKYKARLLALANEAHDSINVLVSDATFNGVRIYGVPTLTLYEANLTVSVEGEKAARAEADLEIDAQRQRALNALETRRIAAQRRVLLLGLTAESKALLDDIPTAASVLTEVKQLEG